MPTILDTLNVQMCTISYGKEASFAGKLANVTITVTPMAAGIGPIRLNWAASGDIFSPFSDTTFGDTGAPGIIALPRTDQDGFRHGTIPFKNWYYKAAVVATLADGQQLARSYQFQTASSTLDLDLLDEDSVVTALPVIVGPGTEPAGLSDTTRTALAATYETLAGGPKRYSRYGFLSGNFRPKAVYNRLGAIEKGTVTQVRWCLTGTSTSLMKWFEYGSDLTRYVGGFAGSYLGGAGSNTRSPRSATGIGQTDTGTITDNGNDTAVWPGHTFTLGTGAVRSFLVGGAAFTFDNAKLYYIGGAGVIAVQVGANAAVQIDTSAIAAGTLGIYTATVPTLAAQAFTVTQVSGSPKIIGAALWNSTLSGIIPISIPAPGMTYSSLANLAWTNFTAFLADARPDMITWEAKAGQWTADAVDTTQLTRMLNAIQAGTPTADVVLIGGPPDSGGSVPGGGAGVSQLDANQLADTVARTYAPTLNVAAWDGYSPLGSWSSVNALDAAAAAAGSATAGDWAGDGVHLGWRAQAFLAEHLVRDLGLYRMSRDKVAAKYAVVDQVIFGKNPNAPVAKLYDDQSFDFDLFLELKRMFRIRALGSGTDWMVIDPAQSGQSWISTDMRLGAIGGPKLAGVPKYSALAGQAGTVVLDLSTATKFTVNLTGNVTAWSFSNYGDNGQEIEVHFVQDATGGRTIATSGSGLGGGSIRLRSGFALNTTALGRTIVKFTQIGGGYYQSAPEVPLAS